MKPVGRTGHLSAVSEYADRWLDRCRGGGFALLVGDLYSIRRKLSRLHALPDPDEPQTISWLLAAREAVDTVRELPDKAWGDFLLVTLPVSVPLTIVVLVELARSLSR